MIHYFFFNNHSPRSRTGGGENIVSFPLPGSSPAEKIYVVDILMYNEGKKNFSVYLPACTLYFLGELEFACLPYYTFNWSSNLSKVEEGETEIKYSSDLYEFILCPPVFLLLIKSLYINTTATI